MLVLSRKLNERIVIDGNIVVTVVQIDRTQIRLGIDAPLDVPVFREEIAPPQDRSGSAASPPRRPVAPPNSPTAGGLAGGVPADGPRHDRGPSRIERHGA